VPPVAANRGTSTQRGPKWCNRHLGPRYVFLFVSCIYQLTKCVFLLFRRYSSANLNEEHQRNAGPSNDWVVWDLGKFFLLASFYQLTKYVFSFFRIYSTANNACQHDTHYTPPPRPNGMWGCWFWTRGWKGCGERCNTGPNDNCVVWALDKLFFLYSSSPHHHHHHKRHLTLPPTFTTPLLPPTNELIGPIAGPNDVLIVWAIGMFSVAQFLFYTS
jgi:hypothetical protein